MYTIQLYKNVSAQKGYNNVRWFSTVTEQESYFNNLNHITFSNCTPIISSDSFLCKGNVNDVRNYSYMRFYDTDEDGNIKKRVYCFIDDVQYKNKDVFELFYTIDSFQTYMLDLNISSCFVEREHVIDDTVGAHTINEGFNCNEYIINNTIVFTSSPTHYVIGTTKDLEDTTVNLSGGLYNGVVHGYEYYTYDDITDFGNAIKSILDNGISDAIVEMFMTDSRLSPTTGKLGASLYPYEETIQISYPTSLNGYTPTNKKLLTYPYCCIEVVNSGGQSMVLEPNYFNDNTIKFRVEGVINSGVQYIISAMNYRNTVLLDSLATLSGVPFPQISWVNDVYSTWLNQNSTSLATNLITGVGSAVIGGVSGAFMGGLPGAIMGASGAVMSLGNNIASAVDMQQKPNSISGAINGLYCVNMGIGNNFQIRLKTINAETARMIDNYFTRYGYKVNREKVPNLTSRSDYNFVKTADCNFTGDIPHKYLTEILNAFNNGVTLWHTNF